MADLKPEMGAALAPVHDHTDRVPQKGIALCLSGGGYRAMIFHLGVLWRLNELAFLPRLDRISSVSGGSITAGLLGLKWNRLAFSNGVATKLLEEVINPLRAFAHQTIDVGSVIKGILLPGSIGDYVVKAYKKYLYGEATLQDLPDDPPRFVINATNVQTGVLWRFSKPYMGDYLVGLVPSPRLSLASAVGASSAFPPVLSPARLTLDPASFAPAKNEPYHRLPYTKDVYLSDGGVYDNLGLETAWKRCETILVSDAGLGLPADPEPAVNWASHSRRILDVIDHQVRSLRKRQLLLGFNEKTRKGTYWSIASDIADYGVHDFLPAPVTRTTELAQIPTRLANLDDVLQERLINWGYAVCDAAMRRWVDPTLPATTTFPYGRGV